LLEKAAAAGDTSVVFKIVNSKTEGSLMSAGDQKILYNALAYAARNGHFDTAEVLIKAGVNVAAPVEVGSTVIMVSAEQGQDAIIDLLLKVSEPRQQE
jgi:ankyrin repeat protein